MTPTSTFCYGATRAGKTHLLATMRKLGRVVIADYDGQVAAEIPDGYVVRRPALLGPDASDAAKQERADAVDRVMSAASQADVVIWPCLSIRDHHILNAAIQQDRLGPLAGGTYGLDSATFLGECLIAAICGITITRSQGGEASDPVYASLPDFTGEGVHRAMEMQDWGRYAMKLNEMLVGTAALCRAKQMHFVATALEEHRELWSGEGRARRLIGMAQGPLLHGQASAKVVPPKFMFYLRLASRYDAEATPPTTKYAAFTAPLDGWPAGVRGAATALPAVIPNPDLPEIIRASGLAGEAV